MRKTTIAILLIISGMLPFSAWAQNNDNRDKLVYKEAFAAGVTFNWAVQEETLYVKLSAPTKGWIAVGFEPSKMMKDADIIIGYVKGTDIVIEDHFGFRPTSHRPDEEIGGTNDVTILGGTEDNGSTTLEFSIPLDSMDTFDRRLEKGKRYKVIVAYGKKDNLETYHKKRGSFEITL